MIAIVDTGVLLGALDRGDRNHSRSLAVLERSDLELIVPALIVAEVCYMAETRLGSAVEAAFLRGLAEFEVEAPSPADWPRIAELVERYADFPLGGADASVAVLADRYETDLILTLDRRHFGSLRSPAGQPYRLLPD
jgi:uncharacterized protein